MMTTSYVRLLGWTLFLALLAFTVLGAAMADRAGWESLLPGEATYLMQSASLAYDGDLLYTREDFDRELLRRRADPTDLELASGSGGRQIGFARPFPYALYLAPFVRLDPLAGFAFANALLLVLAALVSVWTFKPRLGVASPFVGIALIFASAAFADAFLATGGTFLLALAVLAFSLVARCHPQSDSAEDTAEEGGSESGAASGIAGGRAESSDGAISRTFVTRAFFVAGALLAIVVLTRPLDVVLVGAAFFAAPAAHRGVARLALLLGGGLSGLVQLGVQWWATGGLLHVLTTRFRFTPETGFPLVDFTATEWDATLRRLQALHWDEAARFSWGVDLKLWLWNVLDLFAGRNIGLLPYFAPLVLLAILGSFSGWRRALWLAAGAWVAGILILHPFNLYGGPGAIANRLVLPVYGMLWLVAGGRRISRGRALFATLAVALVAIPFLHRLWSSAWSHPVATKRAGYAYVGALAKNWLPRETAQRWIPAGQLADHGALRVLFLDEGAWAESRHDRLRLDGSLVDLVIYSPQPLDVLKIEFGEDGPSRLAVTGAEVAETLLLGDGGIAFRLIPEGPSRVHPLWWSPERWWVYPLRLELAEPSALAFRVLPEQL